MIFLCLFQNRLSVGELISLLVFLLFPLICTVIFSACGGPAQGTRSGIIVLYFLRVECTLELFCYIFHVWRAQTWNALWRYCIIFSACGEPARVMRSGVIVLYFP